MPKLESGFVVSWKEVAIKRLDEVLEAEILQAFSQVKLILQQTRESLVAADEAIAVDMIMRDVSLAVGEAVAEAELLPEHEHLREAKFLQDFIAKIRGDLQFLKDYFDFQFGNFEKRLASGQKFSLLPSNKFMEAYPDYKVGPVTFAKRMRSNHGGSYKKLAVKMGFPVVLNSKDLASLKISLVNELWRVYNLKNGLGLDNRTYQSGSKLPRFDETIYIMPYFEATYGSFTEAVGSVILRAGQKSESNVEIENKEVLEEGQLHYLLRTSLKIGAVPDPKMIEAVSSVLVRDLEDAIARLSVHIPNKEGRGGHYAFNWRQFLIESEYFGEYGVKIYDIWLGHERLDLLTNHQSKMLEKRLKDLFLGKAKLRYMREMPALVEVDRDVDFDNMSAAELKKYIEDHVMNHAFASGVRVSAVVMREILKCYVREGVSIPAVQTHFVLYSRAKVHLELLIAKARFFRENPAIPLYMRQILFAANKTDLAEIGRRIDSFISAGIAEKWYVHFLHVSGVDPMEDAINRLKKADSDYEKILAYHEAKEDVDVETDPQAEFEAIRELLRTYFDEAQLPTLEEVEGLSLRVVRRRIEAVLARGEAVTVGVIDGTSLRSGGKRFEVDKETAAMERLEALGFPFDSIESHGVRLRPSNLAAKAELMLELFGEVRKHLLRSSEARIRAVAMEEQRVSVLRDGDEQSLQRFLEDRGLTQPPDYLRIGPKRMLEIIEEIERRGVPFQSEYWWWLNGTVAQRDAQIESVWMKISKDDRRQEIADIYGFDIAQMPVRAMEFDPDRIREYCKVLSVVGHPAGKYWHLMNLHSPLKFRAVLKDRLARKKSRCLASKEEEFWLKKMNIADEIKLSFAEKIEGVAVENLLEEANEQEVSILEVDNDRRASLLDVLAARVREKKDLEVVLRRHRFGYGDFDYLCRNSASVREVSERIDELKKLGLPVTREVVYACDVNLESLIGFVDDDSLNQEQLRVVTYLENLGCDYLFARKLAVQGQSLVDLRAKVDFFTDQVVDPEDYGKDKLDVDDYYDFLDKPMSFCKRYAPRVRRRLLNSYAGLRLREALGLHWDRDGGWVVDRTTSSTMWGKYVFLSESGVLKQDEDLSRHLVTRYSNFSLDSMVGFLSKLSDRLAVLRIPPKNRELYIQTIVKVLHVLARVLEPGIVSEAVLSEAQKKLLELEEDTEGILAIITRVLRSRQGAHEDVQEISEGLVSGLAEKMYKDVLDVMSLSFLDLSAAAKDRFFSVEEEARLAQLKDEGNKRAFDLLVTKNLPFVCSIAKKYLWSNIPWEDLVQQGNLGLMVAVERFDYRRGNRLLTYSGWWIRQKIGRYVADNLRNVRLPVHVQEESNRYSKAVAQMAGELGRLPTDEELLEKLSIDQYQLDHLKNSATLTKHREKSLDAPVDQDDKGSASMGDFIGNDDQAYEAFTRISSRDKFLAKFKEIFFNEYGTGKSGWGGRDQRADAWQVFLYRFGFSKDNETMILEELGEKFGLTRERVRQIEKGILDFIRSKPEILQELRDLVS